MTAPFDIVKMEALAHADAVLTDADRLLAVEFVQKAISRALAEIVRLRAALGAALGEVARLKAGASEPPEPEFNPCGHPRMCSLGRCFECDRAGKER